MKKLLLCFAVAAMPLANPAFAADSGSITIISPKEGAVLGGGGNKLEYNVHLSPKGNHLHIYIDNQDPIIDKIGRWDNISSVQPSTASYIGAENGA